MGDEVGQKTQWFYNVVTGRVEQEGEGKGTDQLGPYPSREAAEGALQAVHDREQKVREQDREWNGDQ